MNDEPEQPTGKRIPIRLDLTDFGIRDDAQFPEYKPTTLPGSAREDRLILTAQTAVIAMMAAILQAADFERTYEECTTIAHSLYTRTMRQIAQHGL